MNYSAGFEKTISECGTGDHQQLKEWVGVGTADSRDHEHQQKAMDLNNGSSKSDLSQDKKYPFEESNKIRLAVS